MGVFPNENAAARPFHETQQQGKCSNAAEGPAVARDGAFHSGILTNKMTHRLIAAWAILLTLPAAAQLPDATALVRRAMQHRIEATKTHQPLRYQLYKLDASHPHTHITTKDIIETPDGDVARLILSNNQPLTPEADRAELDRLDALAQHPELQQHRQRAEQKDAARIDRLMTLLPDAFLFHIEALETCPAGPCYRLTFKPNPAWTPPDMEADLFRGLAGQAWVDQAQERLVRISATFIADVSFGFGVLARIDKGGTALIEQADIGPEPGQHDWELTGITLHLTGKALLFKAINTQIVEHTSHFTRVAPNLTYRQAIQLLKSPTP